MLTLIRRRLECLYYTKIDFRAKVLPGIKRAIS